MLGGVRRHLVGVAVMMATVLSITLAGGSAALATVGPVTGAIYTTNTAGDEVNGNTKYIDKYDVYLNGGPGLHAPPGGGGLAPDGVYIFMVTDPSGKNLLSTDPIECRQVTVLDGVFHDVTPSDGCAHTSISDVHGFRVQLMPYLDTPNNGGEYKAWVTPADDYCSDTSSKACSNSTFGFLGQFSKTDNFKVGGVIEPEIDTQFIDGATGNPLDGLMITWTDTHGASNNKWSYLDTSVNVNHEAHVEAPEVGTHTITINNQVGCAVGSVQVVNSQTGKSYNTSIDGPQSVSISLSPSMKPGSTIFLYVTCQV